MPPSVSLADTIGIFDATVGAIIVALFPAIGIMLDMLAVKAGTAFGKLPLVPAAPCWKMPPL